MSSPNEEEEFIANSSFQNPSTLSLKGDVRKYISYIERKYIILILYVTFLYKADCN
jgi:hypothetical protein